MMQFDKRFAEKQNDFGIIKSRHIRFSTASSPRCLFTVIQLYPVSGCGRLCTLTPNAKRKHALRTRSTSFEMIAMLTLTSSSFLVAPQFGAYPASALTRTRPVYADETKGALGGAILGGLLAGPFGALWGAQMGGWAGANQRANREAQEKLDRMGLSREVLAAAAAVAKDIEEAEASLSLVRRAEASQRGLVTTLERQSDVLYQAAQDALRGSDESAARARLEERLMLKPKIASAQAELGAASQRTAALEAAMATLQEQAVRVEAMASRSVSASASVSAFDLEPEDPLLRRFKELEDK